MRKILFAVFVLFFGFCYSQPYLPMLEEGNAWGIRIFDIYSPPIPHEYRLGQDVTVNNIVYKEIYKDGILTDCGLREEEGIIYLVDSSNSERVQLDFTLEAGDVFTPVSNPCIGNGIEDFTVLSTSIQFIANQNRKVIELQAGQNPEYWIEGIGSTNGGIYSGIYFIEGASSLQCFLNNGETYFFNSATDCNITLGINSFSSEEITLYPNPVINTSILQLPEAASIDRIKIYDLSGKLIKNVIISKKHFTIDAMDYGSGLYFYQVFSGSNLLKTEKFFIK